MNCVCVQSLVFSHFKLQLKTVTYMLKLMILKKKRNKSYCMNKLWYVLSLGNRVNKYYVLVYTVICTYFDLFSFIIAIKTFYYKYTPYCIEYRVYTTDIYEMLTKLFRRRYQIDIYLYIFFLRFYLRHIKFD